MSYNNTQPGTVMIISIAFIIILFSFIYLNTPQLPHFIIIPTIIIIIMLGFSALNIKVDNQYIRIRFGYGIFFKKFKLKEIKKAEIKKHSWWVGWGIRYDLPNKCWVYNVSGYDVIEITEKSGKKYRLGTNDSKNLQRAIAQKIIQ